jgi:hypothetical protein
MSYVTNTYTLFKPTPSMLLTPIKPNPSMVLTPIKPTIDDEHIRYCLGMEIVAVRQDYLASGARASVCYMIKDPEWTKELGTNT